MIDILEVQKRIRETIRQSNMKQAELGAKIGVSQKSISAYLNQNKFPSLETLANLCQALDVEPNYILCFDKGKLE